MLSAPSKMCAWYAVVPEGLESQEFNLEEDRKTTDVELSTTRGGRDPRRDDQRRWRVHATRRLLCQDQRLNHHLAAEACSRRSVLH